MAGETLKSGVMVEVAVDGGGWARGILDRIEYSHMHGGRMVQNCHVLVDGHPVVVRRNRVRNFSVEKAPESS